MSQAQKTILVVLASIAIGGGAIWVGVSYWIRTAVESGKESMAEGTRYGSQNDEKECVSKALQRDDECAGIGCEVQNIVFLSACLSASESVEGFCDGVPITEEILETVSWRLGQCETAERTSDSCPRLFGALQKYCTTKRSEPR